MILITGATGLLGSYLLAELAKSKVKIRAIKRANSTTDLAKKIFELYGPSDVPFESAVEWVDADILDYHSLLEALDGVQDIYHCAAFVSFDPKDKHLMMKINSEGTSNVMNAAMEKNVRKVCHVSSVAALGKPPHSQIITEENWWKASPGNSQYSITKYSAEREAWRAAEEGLDVVIVNPSIILGAGDWNKGSAAIISAAYKGMHFYSSGISGFVDARDVAKCMIALTLGPFTKERFIISAENMPFRELFNILHDEFGKKRPSIKAGKVLTGITWRAEALRSKISGTIPLITKETAQAAQSTILFSSEKVKKALNLNFIPIKTSAKEICAEYLKQLKTKA
jgi:dihydroflavonol-4-reductase